MEYPPAKSGHHATCSILVGAREQCSQISTPAMETVQASDGLDWLGFFALTPHFNWLLAGKS
jgi:hypothetical protein